MSKRHQHRIATEPHESLRELQHYGTVVSVPIALDASVRSVSVENLNQVLVDTMTLRDLYKKHHWQVSGPTFYQPHLPLPNPLHQQTHLSASSHHATHSP